MCERFKDEEARATACGRDVVTVIAWDTEHGVVGWDAADKFSRCGSGSYAGFSYIEKVRIVNIKKIRQGSIIVTKR